VQVLLVHPLPIENYLVGILTGELPKDWPMEAMKAQAVAARTYAVYQKYNAPDRPYHLESTVLDQVYGGAQHERPGSRAAVAATAGEVLTYRRRPIRAFFHSCCAGRTESALEGWGSAEPYLPGSTCGFCGDCGRASWQLRVPLAKLTQALDDKRLSVGQVREVRVSKLSATERVLELQVEGAARTRALHSEDLRRILGYDQLRSRLFKVRKDGTDVVFSGKGSGHGVGMCQWGARGMALNSFSYRAILDRYYPGAKLQQMY
jgi:stage II sporulation protein D